jgi:hypothetical protein
MSKPSETMTTVTVTDCGFDVTEGEKRTRVLWSKLKEIFAFKVDLFSYDTIRLGFRVDDSNDYFEIDEDWPGFKELVLEIGRRFDIGDSWWSTVAFLPFVESRTTLWRDSRAGSQTS